MTQARTKKALSLELVKGVAPLEKLFQASSWKAGFLRLLKAPWRGDAPSPATAVDELRARVEHHMLNGKATVADALLTVASEDPELYRLAVLRAEADSGGSPTRKPASPSEAGR